LPKQQLINFIHADYLAEFTIKGIVVDDKNSRPLSQAEAYFIDKGLDNVRSREPFRWIIPIGKTNSKGRLALSFNYTWGTVAKGTSPPRASGTFQIRIQHEGFKPNETEFSIEKLQRTGNHDIVDLGTVKLHKV
jgi:hypothetical protein